MIPGLDGIRALAFLLVFAMHTDYLRFGWTGVLLFFVLSGFLITGILVKMKESLAPRAYFLKFYGRRLLRIFPLYYFYLGLMSLVAAVLLSLHFRPQYMQQFLEQVPFALTYVFDFYSAWGGFTEHRFLGHFWSLSVEEQFYLLWPLLILLTPRKYYRPLFLGVILAGPALRLLTAAAFNGGWFGWNYRVTAFGVYVLPFSHLDAFAFGAYISQFRLPRPRLQLALLTILLPLAGYASQWLVTGSLGEPSALGYVHPLGNGMKYVWGYSLLDYTFMVFIYTVARTGLGLRWLEWPFLRYLGKISYGMYVYHYAIVWFVARLRDFGWSEDINKPLIALISFLLTLLIASASYRWLEGPLLTLKERYFSTAGRV